VSDNRQRPRIHRCDDKHDALIRAYARSRGIEPWQALKIAIERLGEEDARAELAAAREATRRADERIAELEDGIEIAAKLGNEAIAERAALAAKFEQARTRIAELETALADWREASGEQPAPKARRRAPEPITCALPRDLERRASKLARSRATTREELINYCITIGIKRLESVARHAPVQAAREKARRAAS
jgi:chromosome segregation ATPase